MSIIHEVHFQGLGLGFILLTAVLDLVGMDYTDKYRLLNEERVVARRMASPQWQSREKPLEKKRNQATFFPLQTTKNEYIIDTQSRDYNSFDELLWSF